MDEKETQKKSLPKWLIASITAGVLVIAVVIALFASGVFSRDKKDANIKTPEIIGLNFEEAQKLLEKSGLSLLITESKIDDSVDEGTVLTQNPQAGEISKSGSTVSVSVSEKSVETEIPEVKYYDKDLAKDVIERAGFEVEIKEIESDDEADGTVISQSVSGKGQTGSKVVITVIKNTETEKADTEVTVVSVTGKTTEEAKTILKKSNLYLKITREEYSNDIEKGKIIYQSPEAKSKANENSVVSVCVSKGKESDVKLIVPNVLYYTKSQARTILSEKGFIMTAKEEYNEKIPAGIVFEQSPKSGVSVKLATVITLSVSKGKNPSASTSTTAAGFTGKLTTVTSGNTTKQNLTNDNNLTTKKPSQTVPKQTTAPVNQSAEKKNVATFRITTDKSSASVGDTVIVSVHLKTNYKIIAVSLPVIYDGDVFEMQNTSASLASFLSFKGSLKSAGYSTNGNWKSPAQIYRKTSNPNYWEKDSTMDRWKIAFATWVGLSSKSTKITTLNDEEVIVTFSLKVKSGASGSNGKILLNDDFLKTYENPAGILAVGRSVTNEVSADFVSYGQTINIDNASATIKIK